jgi:hypothetical protein
MMEETKEPEPPPDSNELKSGEAVSPSGEEPAKQLSPREFIHRRMQELDVEQHPADDLSERSQSAPGPRDSD